MEMHEPTAIEQARRARELREKFFGKPVITNKAPATKAPVQYPDYAAQIAKLEALVLQATKISEELHEKLEKAYTTQPVGTLKEKVEEIVRPILDRHGLTFHHVVSSKKRLIYTVAREECWRAAYETLPMHSIKDIAAIFKRYPATIAQAAIRGNWDSSKRMQTRPRKFSRRKTGGAE